MNMRTYPQVLNMATAVRPVTVQATIRKKPLGQILVDLGELSPSDMIKAAAMHQREDASFGDILRANAMVTDAGLFRGLAVEYGCALADFAHTPPDVRLIDELSPARCVREGVVPWKRIGGATVFATCRPQKFAEFCRSLPPGYGRAMMALAPEKEIQNALLSMRRRTLTTLAETRVTADQSCRGWHSGAIGRVIIGAALLLLIAMITAPQATFLALCIWAILALMANTALKVTAALAALRPPKPGKIVFSSSRSPAPMMKLAVVSIMVPLFKEREIARHLVRRLQGLNYPKELLDICLVVEEDDTVTHAALKAAQLPAWMQQIIVPHGSLKTKPRALNYALDFCRGSIIGVYDAEDAPEPDQIHKVVRRFHERGPQVACLQGILDFYNPRQNWLSRCFTIEYATWFRVVLPGLERLGFAIPLGGTTLFFRREALEKLGGWDAHNVTEDADLGIRLARHGYQTELINTVTYEEANCRVWPWVKQRSRWLKGYAMTWAVHMRAPRRLYRDLGLKKFLGVQLLFGGTLSQFLLAPLLWSFWALPLGLPHPLTSMISHHGFIVLTTLFLSCEVVTVSVGILALDRKRHRGLWAWVPTLHLYFPLAAIAGYKAFWEMIAKPFYWDKTTHGQTGEPTRVRKLTSRSWISLGRLQRPT